MLKIWLLLLPLCSLVAGASSGPDVDVLKCIDWCLDNKLGLNDCIIPAAVHQGPCFTCGPFKTNPFEQLCNGKCVNTQTSANNCGECSNKCGSGICCAGRCSSNAGLEWAYYQNPFTIISDPAYSNFDPSFLKNTTPIYNSSTTYIGLEVSSDSNDISIYGSTETFSPYYFVINHRGYIYAETGGTYTLTTDNDDDIMLAWLGSAAYSGWDRANANMTYDISVNTGPMSVSAELVKGQYYPIRLVYAQAPGRVIFNATLTSPSGEIILGQNTAASPSVVQYSCDGITAPLYPPFGQET